LNIALQHVAFLGDNVAMPRLLALLVLVAASCSDGPDIPRIPPIALSGGGARLMNNARTPFEAYENAYGQMTPCHLRVRTGLGASPQRNYVDSGAALQEITESLRTMQTLVSGEAKAAFDPYIATYTRLASDVERQQPPANWQTRIDVGEKEIKIKFSPSKMPIVSEWPPGMGPRGAPPPEAKTPPESKPPAPPPPPRAPEIPVRLAFKAWKQSHAELVEAFKTGKDAQTAYADILGAISAMKEGLPAARHAKLDLMRAVYEQQNEETKGFTSVPPHGSKELILKQLDVVKETLETEYDPDRK